MLTLGFFRLIDKGEDIGWLDRLREDGVPGVPIPILPEEKLAELLRTDVPERLAPKKEEPVIAPARTCVFCGVEFLSFDKGQRYCTPDCRTEFHRNQYYTQRGRDLPPGKWKTT